MPCVKVGYNEINTYTFLDIFLLVHNSSKRQNPNTKKDVNTLRIEII